MKKIGVITDVHGNILALNKVMQYFEQISVEEILHLGDIVDIGPHPNECFELLTQNPKVTCLLGNHDRDFVMKNPIAQHLSHVPTEHKEYIFAQLTESQRQIAEKFPLYVVRNCAGKKLLFCHYPLRWDLLDKVWQEFPFMEIEHEQTLPNMQRLVGDIPYDAIFFGHKHEYADVVGDKTYVNVGSVGCHPSPFAQCIVIEYDDEQWSYRRVRLDYDMQKVHHDMQLIPYGEQLYKFYFLRIPQ